VQFLCLTDYLATVGRVGAYLLCNKSASFRCDGRLFHSPGPAAANRQRCCMSASQRMFGLGSLWALVVAHEHRRQDGSRTMAKCQTAADEPASQPWSRCAGVPVVSVADGAPATLCGLNVESNWRRRSEPTATGSLVLPRCRRTEKDHTKLRRTNSSRYT